MTGKVAREIQNWHQETLDRIDVIEKALDSIEEEAMNYGIDIDWKDDEEDE